MPDAFLCYQFKISVFQLKIVVIIIIIVIHIVTIV